MRGKIRGMVGMEGVAGMNLAKRLVRDVYYLSNFGIERFIYTKMSIGIDKNVYRYR